jgi:hypothetical protein
MIITDEPLCLINQHRLTENGRALNVCSLVRASRMPVFLHCCTVGFNTALHCLRQQCSYKAFTAARRSFRATLFNYQSTSPHLSRADQFCSLSSRRRLGSISTPCTRQVLEQRPSPARFPFCLFCSAKCRLQRLRLPCQPVLWRPRPRPSRTARIRPPGHAPQPRL